MFHYDLWANNLWFAPARQMGSESILGHHVAAMEIWLGRCKDTIEAHPEETLENRLGAAHDSWVNYLESIDIETVITYTNYRNETMMRTVSDIAYHVINHGTYHRGDLRGRCAALGLTDFPETDYIAYLRLRGSQPVS